MCVKTLSVVDMHGNSVVLLCFPICNDVYNKLKYSLVLSAYIIDLFCVCQFSVCHTFVSYVVSIPSLILIESFQDTEVPVGN